MLWLAAISQFVNHFDRLEWLLAPRPYFSQGQGLLRTFPTLCEMSNGTRYHELEEYLDLLGRTRMNSAFQAPVQDKGSMAAGRLCAGH